MTYPYPKIAKVVHQDTARDGGTKVYKILNKDEIGFPFVYQDFRIRSKKTDKEGKFYTLYPESEGSEEIISNFIDIQ